MPADDHDPYALTYQAAPGARRQQAITIAMLARRMGWTTKRAQTVVARLKPPVEPFPDPLDGRTPAYPREQLLKAIERRPGTGAHLRGHS